MVRGICNCWYYGSSCFVTYWLIKHLLHTGAASKTNYSISRQSVNDGRGKNFHELLVFFGLKNVSSLLPNCSFKKKHSYLASMFFQMMPFYDLKVFLEQIHYEVAKKPEKLFWTTLKELIFGLAGKQLEQFQSREVSCVHR